MTSLTKPGQSPFDPKHDPTEEDLDHVSDAMVQDAIQQCAAVRARSLERLKSKIRQAAFLDLETRREDHSPGGGIDFPLG